MLRRTNGIVALALLAIFAAHELMGALFANGLVTDDLSWIVWLGVALSLAHVALSVGTTRQMLADGARPPSTRKKAHQLKKWITGILLCAVAVAHVLVGIGSGLWMLAAVALAIALTVHVCVSAKSLEKDIGVALGYRNLFRCIVVLASVLAAVGVCVSDIA